MSASALAKLSDSELETILGPCIAHCRPDEARRHQPKIVPRIHPKSTQDKSKELLNLFEKKFGIT